jgi:hypothetical protein
MIRLGVHRLDQYRGAGKGLKGWLRRGHLDYRLLRTSIPASPLEVEVFEDITRRMQLASGIFRTTSPARFRDLNEWITPILASHFAPETALDVRDWAASDCSTSVAWHAALKMAFPDAVLTASDLNVYLIEMPIDGTRSYILDAGLGLLQYAAPPLVIRMVPPESPFLAMNWLLARRARSRFDSLWRERGIDGDAIRFKPGVEELRQQQTVFRRIPLIHPTAVALERQTPSFRIERHSIFERAETPAQVIRTMNILNNSYFDPPMLERGARTVWESLQPDGLWIVGRTVQEEPTIHHASILMRKDKGFELVARHIEKSEIEDLALAVQM